MSAESVLRRTVTVQLLNGLHLRPASLIARAVSGSNCQVRILNGGTIADARNVFDLIALNAPRGTELTLEADGEGAAEVLEAIAGYFEVEDAGPDDEPA